MRTQCNLRSNLHWWIYVSNTEPPENSLYLFSFYHTLTHATNTLHAHHILFTCFYAQIGSKLPDLNHPKRVSACAKCIQVTSPNGLLHMWDVSMSLNMLTTQVGPAQAGFKMDPITTQVGRVHMLHACVGSDSPNPLTGPSGPTHMVATIDHVVDHCRYEFISLRLRPTFDHRSKR